MLGLQGYKGSSQDVCFFLTLRLRHTLKRKFKSMYFEDFCPKLCKELKADEKLNEYVQQNTGLVIDSYFSATKIKWILDNVPKAKALREKDALLFGTVDTWLLWNLTKGKVHATDYSNASRTMVYNIVNLEWDKNMLAKFDIPASMLPDVKPSSFHFGNCSFDDHVIPISGIAGDQQAALFGQACFLKGETKNTKSLCA